MTYKVVDVGNGDVAKNLQKVIESNAIQSWELVQFSEVTDFKGCCCFKNEFNHGIAIFVQK